MIKFNVFFAASLSLKRQVKTRKLTRKGNGGFVVRLLPGWQRSCLECREAAHAGAGEPGARGRQLLTSRSYKARLLDSLGLWKISLPRRRRERKGPHPASILMVRFWPVSKSMWWLALFRLSAGPFALLRHDGGTLDSASGMMSLLVGQTAAQLIDN